MSGFCFFRLTRRYRRNLGRFGGSIPAGQYPRAVSVVLDDPTHIGQIYNLTGFKSADLEHYARVFSEALGRTIRYRDVRNRDAVCCGA